eukprot:364228-Chlamydomonas_euryale.AAC.1
MRRPSTMPSPRSCWRRRRAFSRETRLACCLSRRHESTRACSKSCARCSTGPRLQRRCSCASAKTISSSRSSRRACCRRRRYWSRCV